MMKIAIVQGAPSEYTKEGFEKLFGDDSKVVIIEGGAPICPTEDDAIKADRAYRGLFKDKKTGTNKSDRKRNRKNRWR